MSIVNDLTSLSNRGGLLLLLLLLLNCIEYNKKITIIKTRIIQIITLLSFV